MNRSHLSTKFAAFFAAVSFFFSLPTANSQVALTAALTPIGGSTVVNAEAVCQDNAGNIYAVIASGTTLVEIPANGGPIVTMTTALSASRGVAVDSKGNVFVGQAGSTSLPILEYPAGGGAAITVGTVSKPFLMAVDSSDNLYVTDGNSSKVVKFAAGTFASTSYAVTVPTGGSLHGIAVDPSGNMYVTFYSVASTAADGAVISPAGVQTSLPITGLTSPYGIALDSSLNLYIADPGTTKVLKYAPPYTGTPIVLAPVVSALSGLIVGNHGDVLVAAARVYSLQTGTNNFAGAINFYGDSVLTATPASVLTFTLPTATTTGTPVFTSNGSATALFKDAGGETTGCTSGKAIAAGATCTLNVAFTPQQVGISTGTVTITDSTSHALYTVPLSGIGSASLSSFNPGTQTALTSTFTQPAGLAFDSGGDLFTVDTSLQTVSKTTSAGVTTVLGFTGLVRPVGVAVDAAGSVYVSDASSNAIYRLTTAGVQSTITTSGLSAPKGIAIDGLNNLYIADSGNARVVRIDSTGAQTTVGFTSLAAPSWVAVDIPGNIYVSDSGKILENSLAGSQKTISITGVTAPVGIAVGTDGAIYAADSAAGIIGATLISGKMLSLGSSLAQPSGLALAANGNLYVANSTTGQIAIIDRTKQSLVFPATASGATSAPLTATVQNTGNGPLNYSAFAVTTGFTQATPVASTDCSATAVVASGGTCAANIVFAPTTLGAITGTATQTDNVLNVTTATQTIQLSGTGIRSSTSALALTTPSTGNPVYGNALSFTLHVTPGDGNAGTPTGNVTFTLDGGTPTPSIGLSSGQATYSPTVVAAGNHTLVATYTGDGTFAASTSNTVSFTVAPAVLTVTAVSQTRQYGVANATLQYNITGFAYSDTASVVTGTAGISTTATTTSDPGVFPITLTPGTLSSPNYTFTLVNGSITVTKATNTITFPQIADKTYGNTAFNISATTNSSLPVTFTALTSNVTVTNGTQPFVTITGAGTAQIAADQAGNTDYAAATRVIITFNIAKAVLTFTADNLSKQQGQVNPTLTYTTSGFQYADTSVVLSGAPGLSTTAITTSGTGSYPITISAGTLAAANYSFAFVNGTLTVTGTTPQTITFNALPNVTYGNGVITLAASSSSGQPISYVVKGASLSGNVITLTGIGTVTVTASQVGNATYAAATPVTQSFTVSPATLLVTTANQTRVINTANPTFTYTITGFVYTDTISVVSGAPSITTTATTSSAAGSYPITTTQGTLSASNYIFTFSAATLTVTTAPQTITFAALPDVTYGATPITLSATASSSLPVTYSVTGPATVSGSILTITGAGKVCVTASQAGNAMYSAATAVVQCFTVQPALLSVTASDATIVYGQPIPTTFAYTITGFQYSDTSSVVTGKPAITTTATATSPAGPYPITPTLGTLTASANYTFTAASFVPGTLTITSANQTITFAALPTIPQTTTTVTLNASASSGLPITYTVTGPATPTTITATGPTTLTITGPGTVTVVASQLGNVSFQPATPVTQSFVVTGTTTIALTSSTPTQNLGSAVILTAVVTGKITADIPSGTVTFFAGTTQLGTSVACAAQTGTLTCKAALSTTAIPSGSITLTAVYSGDGNYTGVTSAGLAILIVAGDFNLTATSTNLSIAQGASGSTTITVTPLGGYSDTLKLGCSSLPANMYCTFTPAALNFYPGTGTSTAPQNTVLTITAKAEQTSMLLPGILHRERNEITWAALFFGAPCFAFVCGGRRRKILRRLFGSAMIILLTLAASAGISGCGSNVTNLAAPGTYNVSVNFTDGTSVVHTLIVTVTVTGQ